MYKNFFAICVAALLVSSCTVKEDIQDNIDHYHKLTRDHDIRELSYTKYTNDIAGVRFLVANHPDQVIDLEGKSFDERYKKALGLS